MHLEFVQGRKFHNVETIWCENIGFSMQEVFGLQASDLGHCGEDVSGVAGSSFNAVLVVDLQLCID